MVVCIRSAGVVGIDACDVIVEVDVAPGLPNWTIVGLASGAVKESRERVVAALLNSGYAVPARRVTVNLAPAELRKASSGFDLPIALALLVATKQIDGGCVVRASAVGELALDGTIRPVRGVLPIARLVGARNGALIVPRENAAEASLVSALTVGAPRTLCEAVDQLQSNRLERPDTAPSAARATDDGPDLSDVVGQELARRALEIAAAGDHGLVLTGPPGSGKTLLARCTPRILPRLLGRAAPGIRFPAQFTLIGAATPCPCGYAGDGTGRCVCTSAEIVKYRGRISGPLADRIDLHVNVSAVPVRQLGDARPREKSMSVRSRVESARAAQRVRYTRMAGDVWNGRVPGRWLDRHGCLSSSGRELLAEASERMGVSARSYHRILRVARTIADLDGARIIDPRHVAEAVRDRPPLQFGMAATTASKRRRL